MRNRKRANQFAKAALESGSYVTDAVVLAALRLWRFKKNKVRKNVMRDGQEWVHSETLGVVLSRAGRILLSRITREYPDFMRLLCNWIQNMRPTALKDPFPFTSISMNFDYAASRHRDGTSLIEVTVVCHDYGLCSLHDCPFAGH